MVCDLRVVVYGKPFLRSPGRTEATPGEKLQGPRPALRGLILTETRRARRYINNDRRTSAVPYITLEQSRAGSRANVLFVCSS